MTGGRRPDTRATPWGNAVGIALLAACLAGCDSVQGFDRDLRPPMAPVQSPGPGTLVRLHADQLRTALIQLFGPIETGGPLEPDPASGGLRALGSATKSVSAWGVEQYEALALSVAGQAVKPEHRAAWMPCLEATPTCSTEALRGLAQRAWRRSVEADEIEALSRLTEDAFVVLQDRYEALGFSVAAILQSPAFLYRFEVEVRKTDDRLLASSLATRLSFFLADSPPDQALLEAVWNGDLANPERYAFEVDRLLAAGSSGMRAFFEDMLHLYLVQDITKDAQQYPYFSTDLPFDARKETLLFLEQVLWNQGQGYLSAFTEPTTFVNRRLAALYGVRAPTQTGFGFVELDSDMGRRGLLGQASLLMLNAHPAASSATLRGQFVRETLLCGTIPPPPSGVDTSLPEPSGAAPTLRDRVKEHLENPSCAGCHSLMDPVGLGLEQFDSVGRFRRTEGGAPIDPSGELDGAAFRDAWQLGQVVASHPKVPECLVRTLYRYAVSRDIDLGEEALIRSLVARFSASEYHVPALMRDIALSEGFTKVRREP